MYIKVDKTKYIWLPCLLGGFFQYEKALMNQLVTSVLEPRCGSSQVFYKPQIQQRKMQKETLKGMQEKKKKHIYCITSLSFILH